MVFCGRSDCRRRGNEFHARSSGRQKFIGVLFLGIAFANGQGSVTGMEIRSG